MAKEKIASNVEEELIAYSLDQLEEQEKDKFERHRDADPDLKDTINQKLDEMQFALETIAMAEQPMQPRDQLKEALFASLQSDTPFAGYVKRFMDLFDLNKSAVEDLFSKIINETDSLFVASGIPKTSLHYFSGGSKVINDTCGIVKIKAGSLFPAHRHRGKEWILVLQGTAIDNSGIKYLPGDTIYSDSSVSHSLLVGDEEDLIYGVVLEKPNKWLIGQTILDFLFTKKRFKL
jgi:sugar-specific transcriptional regulator TrmB